ncbi:MAG: 50S ribosomal protein L25 [bacterium]|nr:50S ribosomal protein L25 [bacterium]
MAENVVLTAVPRAQAGKVNRLRREGFVPAILYGHEQSPLSLAVEEGALAGVLRIVSSSTLLTLTVSGDDARRVLIQEVQHHPLTGDPIHIDFHQVNLTEKIRANVPVRAVGVSPAVKDLGGVLVQSIAEIEVEALPQDLPTEIAMDLAALTTFAHRITVADLPIPPKVEVHARLEDVVAVVSPPRTEEEMEELKTAVEEKVGEVKTEAEEKKAAEEAKKVEEGTAEPGSKSEKPA